MSFIEIIITLFIFGLSIAVISSQVEFDMNGINSVKNNIAEIYRNGV